jgi:hypothetical protein
MCDFPCRIGCSKSCSISSDIVCSRLRGEGGTTGAAAAKIHELLAGLLFIPLYRDLDSGPATLGRPVSVREAPFPVPLAAAVQLATTPLRAGTPPVSGRPVVATPASPAVVTASPIRTPNSQGWREETRCLFVLMLKCTRYPVSKPFLRLFEEENRM